MYQVSEITVSYKPRFKISDRPIIRDSRTIVKILREFWGDDINLYESVNIILLNNANHVLGFSRITTGTIDSSIVDIYKILQIALTAHANGIILAHNHPSGNLSPSNADLKMTKALDEAAKLMKIRFLDHIILTENSYTSFKDECLM